MTTFLRRSWRCRRNGLLVDRLAPSLSNPSNDEGRAYDIVATIRSFCTTCRKPSGCSPCGAPNAGVKYRKSGGRRSLPVGQKTVRAEETDMAAVELKFAARMRSPRSEQ